MMKIGTRISPDWLDRPDDLAFLKQIGSDLRAGLAQHGQHQQTADYRVSPHGLCHVCLPRLRSGNSPAKLSRQCSESGRLGLQQF